MEVYYDQDERGPDTAESLGTYMEFDTTSSVTVTRLTDGTQDGEYALVVRLWDKAGNKYEDTRW